MGQGHYSSFILRLWVEPPDGVRWGVIQHVATREQLRFKVLDPEGMPELLEFIRKHAGDDEVSLPFVLGTGEQPVDGLNNGQSSEPTEAIQTPTTKIRITTTQQPPKSRIENPKP